MREDPHRRHLLWDTHGSTFSTTAPPFTALRLRVRAARTTLPAGRPSGRASICRLKGTWDEHDVTGRPAQPGLKRSIGPKLLLLFIVGDILGTGVYALTGDVAGEVGGQGGPPSSSPSPSPP